MCIYMCFIRKNLTYQASHVPGFLSFLSTLRSPIIFIFFKAIRHCRICQLRSSKRFWDCGVHRKLYKNISSYFICQVHILVPLPVFQNPRATISFFLVPRVRSLDPLGKFCQSDKTNPLFSFSFFFCPIGNEKRNTRPFRLFTLRSLGSSFATLLILSSL